MRAFLTFCVIVFVMMGLPAWVAVFAGAVVVSLWISWITREIMDYRQRRRGR